jgi:hypothetical protein
MKPALPTPTRSALTDALLRVAPRIGALAAAALPALANAAGGNGASLPFGLSEGYALAAGAVGMVLFMASRRGSR